MKQYIIDKLLTEEERDFYNEREESTFQEMADKRKCSKQYMHKEYKKIVQRIKDEGIKLSNFQEWMMYYSEENGNAERIDEFLQ